MTSASRSAHIRAPTKTIISFSSGPEAACHDQITFRPACPLPHMLAFQNGELLAKSGAPAT